MKPKEQKKRKSNLLEKLTCVIRRRTKHKSIHPMLDVSTGHISLETAIFLQRETENYNAPQIIVYEKGEYGFFIPVIPEAFEEYEQLPDDLMALLNFALSRGVSWIMLDRDGDTIEGLTYNEW